MEENISDRELLVGGGLMVVDSEQIEMLKRYDCRGKEDMAWLWL